MAQSSTFVQSGEKGTERKREEGREDGDGEDDDAGEDEDQYVGVKMGCPERV